MNTLGVNSKSGISWGGRGRGENVVFRMSLLGEWVQRREVHTNLREITEWLLVTPATHGRGSRLLGETSRNRKDHSDSNPNFEVRVALLYWLRHRAARPRRGRKASGLTSPQNPVSTARPLAVIDRTWSELVWHSHEDELRKLFSSVQVSPRFPSYPYPTSPKSNNVTLTIDRKGAGSGSLYGALSGNKPRQQQTTEYCSLCKHLVSGRYSI